MKQTGRLKTNPPSPELPTRVHLLAIETAYPEFWDDFADKTNKDNQMPKRKNPNHHATIAKYADKETVRDRAASIKNQKLSEGAESVNLEVNGGIA